MSLQELIPYPLDAVQEPDLILSKTVRRWADKEVLAGRLEHGEDYDNLIKPAMRKLFVDVELQKMIWPQKYGGAGMNTAEAARALVPALEQVGRADTGIGFLYAVTFALCSTFAMEERNVELCGRLAPLFCQSGEAVTGSLILPVYARSGHAPGEPLFRGRRLQARARLEGGDWVVSGDGLRPLNSGSDASLFGVLCALEGEDEPGLILVPGDAPGLKRGAVILKTGLAASANASLEMAAVRVPSGNLVFRGEEAYRRMMSWLYLSSGAVTVGSMLAAYEMIGEWGDTRVIKGKGRPFKENPLAASVMAEVGHEIMIGRLLVYQLAQMTARLEAYRQPGGLFIPALGVASHVTLSAERAINRVMELMGSAGYATEWNLERYWRDVKTMQVHLGSWELNKMELARHLYGCRTL